MSKRVYIIAGANGSGKSTLAKKLLNEERLTFLNADELAKELSPNDIEKAKISAGKRLFSLLDETMRGGRSFAVESTLSGTAHVKTIERAKAAGYDIFLIYVFLDTPDMCIARIKGRVKKGGHFIPDEDVRRRYSRSIRNFNTIYKNLADGWFLYYNGMEQTAVANYENGCLEILNAELFASFQEKCNDD